ncbi:MAG: metallophosphatase family protein [Desulfobacterales bacterium]|jgi:putative phosphoesterase|nr:metallophosphatase family protein [Desulfobacterales bacterium]
MDKELKNKHSYIVGVISDTHGLIRPEAAKAFKGADLIIHSGDIGSLDVLVELKKIAPVKAVRGNMDAGDWAIKLPAADIIEIGDVLIYVLHDVFKLDVDPVATGVHTVISGHTHRSSSEYKNSVLFLNPGTAGPFKPPVSVARLRINGTSIEPHIIALNI